MPGPASLGSLGQPGGLASLKAVFQSALTVSIAPFARNAIEVSLTLTSEMIGGV